MFNGISEKSNSLKFGVLGRLQFSVLVMVSFILYSPIARLFSVVVVLVIIIPQYERIYLTPPTLYETMFFPGCRGLILQPPQRYLLLHWFFFSLFLLSIPYGFFRRTVIVIT
jgi:hypothetical protein